MKNITYRLAKNNEQDLNILFDLNVEFEKFNQATSTRPSEHFEGDWQTYFREEIAESLRKKLNWIILAFFDETPVGFIYSRVCKDCYEYIIDQLYVSPDYRNYGIGKELLKKSIEKGKKFKYPITVEVFDWNESAYNFYKKSGFDLDAHVLVFRR